MKAAVAASLTSHKDKRLDLAPETEIALLRPYTPSPDFISP